ncbi:MAG: FxsA family protein, partial [Proteobacteria bacterium]|nr:FxsA family protein [Pseudomonadota bacterium]
MTLPDGASACRKEPERTNVFVRLLLLLTVVPFVELMILLRLAEWLRWDGTIALVVFTGVLGAWLARREGLKAITKIQADLAAGVAPAGAVVDGLLILVAGIVLVTPGILTDLCGFGLLIPPVRRLV